MFGRIVSDTNRLNNLKGKRARIPIFSRDKHLRPGKGKSVPLQARGAQRGSRKLRFPDYLAMAQDGGKVVSLTHRPLLPPRKYSWYSFLLEAESTPGP